MASAFLSRLPCMVGWMTFTWSGPSLREKKLSGTKGRGGKALFCCRFQTSRKATLLLRESVSLARSDDASWHPRQACSGKRLVLRRVECHLDWQRGRGRRAPQSVPECLWWATIFSATSPSHPFFCQTPFFMPAPLHDDAMHCRVRLTVLPPSATTQSLAMPRSWL